MRRKGHIVNRDRRRLPSGPDTPLLFTDDLPRYDVSRNADTLIKLVLMNPFNKAILNRMHLLNAPDCWLASGCLFQTVWNVMTGRPPCADILDYDLIYYDPDQSREAEEAVNFRSGALFQDLDIKIHVRNQSRVHLWHIPESGKPYPELQSTCESLRYYPAKIQAIALQGRGSSRISYDAPFGFENLLRMIVRPNHTRDFSTLYTAKTKRWKDVWPKLTVYPWQ